MAQVINTNILSINAQRNLMTTQTSLATAVQRLSSGLRINSAKDDAAGMAISERFTTQIRGLNQAIRNANDGISLAQTAEGALASITNNLQRIRELAVQSSNATNSSTDRRALQAEVTQLVSEVDRVARQSEFNGTKLLDGTFSAQLFQVGANATQTIAVSEIANAQTGSLGGRIFAANIDGGPIDGASFTPDPTDPSRIIIEAGDLVINDVDLGEVVFEIGVDDDATAANAIRAITSAINNKLNETGIYAQPNEDGDGVTLIAVQGNRDIIVSGLTDFGIDDADSVEIDLDQDTTFVREFASDLNVSTVAGSQRALEVIDAALTTINSARADLGAVQNRFISTIENLSISAENLTASRSRILDADFAAETAALSRAQILQQAGTAMVAQANQVPQGVLQLLQR